MLRSLLLLTVPFMSITAHAMTFDYRHETNDKGGNNHKDRLLMSHRFANGFGLSLEGKWKGSQNKDKAYNETVSNGTEVVASYIYKINKIFQIEPGFSLDTNSSSNNYRPYLRGKTNLSNDVSINFRYRPYFKRNSNNIGTKKILPRMAIT
ncbi:Oligogalacturonate-specific porin KdgM [Klebsiella grimontii]|nr:Oligogalacturonate-specific porin KdgM [Klebsiella grimontii]